MLFVNTAASGSSWTSRAHFASARLQALRCPARRRRDSRHRKTIRQTAGYSGTKSNGWRRATGAYHSRLQGTACHRAQGKGLPASHISYTSSIVQ